MKNATELLGELLRIYDEPEKGAGEVHSWVHQHEERIRAVIEKGVDDTERLDWYEEHVCKGYLVPQPEDKSFRAAIDRARGEGE